MAALKWPLKGNDAMSNNENSNPAYHALDRPEVLQYLFHPRQAYGLPGGDGPYNDVLIPVEDGIVIGGRFHMGSQKSVNILFFHGNGEIVSDYDDLGVLYNQVGINFLPVDYRGYGRSTGQPTVTAMMTDCHLIFDFVKQWLQAEAFVGPLIVMGRSLGSASALELAASRSSDIDGLIIESGFAYAKPLLGLLGVDSDALGFSEAEGFRNIDKIAAFKKPVLIIHAEYDHIIPFTDGRALYEAVGSDAKTLLKIPGANHNDIFMRGLKPYLAAIQDLCAKVKTK